MSASVENGGKAFEKSGAAPPVVIAIPDDETHVGADDKFKKDARLTKFAKGLNYFRIAKYLFFLLAMVGIIVLALQVSKDQDTIQKLNHEMGTASRVYDAPLEDTIGGRMSYLEGFSGMVDEDETAALAARDVMTSHDLSTVTSTFISTLPSTSLSSVGETSATETCTTTSDTTVNVFKTTTTFVSAVGSTTVTEESTTTSDMTQTTLRTQRTTTVFSNTGISVLSAAASSLPAGTSLFSVDPLSASMDSSMATLTAMPTTTTTTVPAPAPTTPGLVPANPSNCLEFGDGAGPCNRPYGAPNTPPSSITLSVNSAATTYPPPSLSAIPSTSPSIPGGVIPSTTLDTGAMSGTATTTSSTVGNMDTSTVSGTTTTTSSSTVSGMETSTVSSTTITTSSTISDVETSICGPPTTVYVTLSSSTDTLSVHGGVTIASFGSGSGSSPSTVTSTTTSLATTITVSLASATTTVSNSSTVKTSSHMLTATGFTLTMTAHGNGTYSPTTTGPATIATLPANSGGDRTAGGKPMGASGNGGTGNGMYCVVMLVTLLALLI